MGLRLTKSITFILLMMVAALSYGQQGFTQKDRDLLIAMKTRLDGVDKRFEQIDKRFEQVDIRFAELRQDMNKRFEQVDKRFEEVGKRFEEMITYIGILAAIFAAVTLGTIGFAVWDRRTMIRPFETKVAEINEKIAANTDILNNMCAFFKEYAAKNKTFAGIIRRFNLF